MAWRAFSAFGGSVGRRRASAACGLGAAGTLWRQYNEREDEDDDSENEDDDSEDDGCAAPRTVWAWGGSS